MLPSAYYEIWQQCNFILLRRSAPLRFSLLLLLYDNAWMPVTVSRSGGFWLLVECWWWVRFAVFLVCLPHHLWFVSISVWVVLVLYLFLCVVVLLLIVCVAADFVVAVAVGGGWLIFDTVLLSLYGRLLLLLSLLPSVICLTESAVFFCCCWLPSFSLERIFCCRCSAVLLVERKKN